ncbi:MAG: S9 family peptidase [Chlorobiaceae bacterium]|nr:S9 family peptidase [Chlorobiaceae bacterium]
MTERTTLTGRLSAILCISAILTTPCLPALADQKPEFAAPTGEVVETLCGEKVPDPYRGLENLKDPQVQAWYRQESDRARAALDAIPGRSELIVKMQEFDKRRPAKVYDLVITDNDVYFYLKQTPADETGKLYFRKGFHGKESKLLDPATYSEGGNSFVISKVSPNIDGSKIVVSLSPNGSENSVLLIMDVESGKIHTERIDRCWFAAPSWLPDGKSFFYNRLNPGAMHDKDREKDSRIFLHVTGTDPSRDREIFSRTNNPDMGIRPEDIPAVAYDRKSNRLYASTESVDPKINAWYAPVKTVSKKTIPWKRLIRPEDEVYDFATTKSDIYLYTPKNAPRFKVLKTSLDKPDIAHARTVIAEQPGASLSGYALTSDGIFYTLSINGVKEEFYHLGYGKKSAEKITLPFDAGTIHLGSKGYDKQEVWAIMAGWSHDYRRFRYELKQNRFIDETLSSPAEYPEYADLKVEEVMVPSHDGVMVPLSLIHNRALAKNGSAPVLIYGYGAYGNSMTPFFSPSLLLWTLKGGVLAVAHVRGGGELGDAWHKAGMKTTKPNTWKDLIACAEYLIREGYTSPKHIAINAASAGGILVGRAMTERPDLFAAAMPQVGALNPLRGEESPNGPVNVPEFGTVRVPDECRALIEMDPYLHLQNGVSYPATLVTAGMNDPRVIAWQPGKFAARLQVSTASKKPVLFFTDYKAGHGIGDSKTKQFESLADMLSFGLWNTGHPEFQPKQ